jgi:hypothetical protein
MRFLQPDLEDNVEIGFRDRLENRVRKMKGNPNLKPIWNRVDMKGSNTRNMRSMVAKQPNSNPSFHSS